MMVLSGCLIATLPRPLLDTSMRHILGWQEKHTKVLVDGFAELMLG